MAGNARKRVAGGTRLALCHADRDAPREAEPVCERRGTGLGSGAGAGGEAGDRELRGYARCRAGHGDGAGADAGDFTDAIGRTAACSHGSPRAAEADNFSGRPGSKRVGEHFELLARRFLEAQCLAWVASNVVVRGGELDLVMRERDGTLVFVEVRARRHRRHGGAIASVGRHKRRRVVQAALVVWARLGGACACRFDVVAFEAGRLVWLRDAFRADDV